MADCKQKPLGVLRVVRVSQGCPAECFCARCSCSPHLWSAEDPEHSLGRVGLELGDDALDAQMYFILTMLLKEDLMEKVQTVEYGEGLRIWQLLVTDVEPKLASRKRVCSRGFSISRSVQVRIRGRESIVHKRTSDSTSQPPGRKLTMKRGQEFLLRAFANGSELHRNLGHHLVLNACRVESFSELKREVRDHLGMKQAKANRKETSNVT